MKRRLFTILSAPSLLLCVAVCVLWVRSYAHLEIGTASRGYQRFMFFNMYGRVQLEWNTVPEEQESQWGIIYARAIHESEPVRPFPFAFAAWRREETYAPHRLPTTNRALTLPHWFVATLALIPPFIWVWKVRRKRARVGLCPSCGGDLRATPSQ